MSRRAVRTPRGPLKGPAVSSPREAHRLRHKYLGLDGGIRASRFSAQESLTVHFRFQTSDIATAEVFAEFINLLQLEKMNPQNLDRFHHLEAENTKAQRTRRHGVRAPSPARRSSRLLACTPRGHCHLHCQQQAWSDAGCQARADPSSATARAWRCGSIWCAGRRDSPGDLGEPGAGPAGPRPAPSLTRDPSLCSCSFYRRGRPVLASPQVSPLTKFSLPTLPFTDRAVGSSPGTLCLALGQP